MAARDRGAPVSLKRFASVDDEDLHVPVSRNRALEPAVRCVFDQGNHVGPTEKARLHPGRRQFGAIRGTNPVTRLRIGAFALLHGPGLVSAMSGSSTFETTGGRGRKRY